MAAFTAAELFGKAAAWTTSNEPNESNPAQASESICVFLLMSVPFCSTPCWRELYSTAAIYVREPKAPR
jgi:hypothetical protein